MSPRFGMNPGLLREEVELQEESRASDGQGGATLSYATYATVRARIKPKSAREQETAMRLGAPATHTLTVRAGEDIEAADRLIWGTQKLHLESGPLNLDERGMYLAFDATVSGAA